MMRNWYKISKSNKNTCSNCEEQFEGLQSLDHHSGICPKCNIDCIWFSFNEGKTIQIIPEYAPKEFQAFIRWAQEELDELEFLELVVSFEEIANALKL